MYEFRCSRCNATYYGESERHFFVRASEDLVMTPLTKKRVKNTKKPVIVDDILLKGHEASFEDFTILLKETKKFKLHLKDTLLIKCDKPDFNPNLGGLFRVCFGGGEISSPPPPALPSCLKFITGSAVMTIDQNSRNQKYPRLSFAHYLETGAS